MPPIAAYLVDGKTWPRPWKMFIISRFGWLSTLGCGCWSLAGRCLVVADEQLLGGIPHSPFASELLRRRFQ